MLTRKSLRIAWRLAVSLAAFFLYSLLEPRAEAAWESLNHGDPVLEVLAALLVVIVLVLIWLAIHMLWPARE